MLWGAGVGSESRPPFDVRGNVAVITGAAGGIGRGIVRVLANAGANIVIFDSNEAGAAEVAEVARSCGVTGRVVLGDVTTEDDVTKAVEQAVREFGRLDILVNNAGVITRVQGNETIRGQELLDWHRVFSINLDGAFLCTKMALVPMMERRYGRIVNVTSMITKWGGYGIGAAYGASKAALAHLTKATAVQGASFRVTCNAVAPHAIDAGMTQQQTPESRAAVVQSVPLGRLGTPDEVGYAVLFLASPASGFITGQTLHVNGGVAMVD